jgi:cbb3-type cytochrome oxidase subunit 3
MANGIKRTRRRLRARQALGGLAIAILLLACMWMLLPGLPGRLRDAMLAALLILVAAGQVAVYRTGARRRKSRAAEPEREAAAPPGADADH